MIAHGVRLHGKKPDHVDSEETRPSINSVIFTTVLEVFAEAWRAKDVFSTSEDAARCHGLNTMTVSTTR